MGELAEMLAAFFLLMTGLGLALVVIGRAGPGREPRGMRKVAGMEDSPPPLRNPDALL